MKASNDDYWKIKCPWCEKDFSYGEHESKFIECPECHKQLVVRVKKVYRIEVSKIEWEKFSDEEKPSGPEHNPYWPGNPYNK